MPYLSEKAFAQVEQALPILEALHEWDTAYVVKDNKGAVLGLVRDKAVAKKVQEAISAHVQEGAS